MRLSHSALAITMGAWLGIGVPVSASANVITDWDEKAVAIIAPMASLGKTPPDMERLMAMVHAAMFDAVNSIERRYHPYLVQLPVDHLEGGRSCNSSRWSAGDHRCKNRGRNANGIGSLPHVDS
jgi:hypothetical protein